MADLSITEAISALRTDVLGRNAEAKRFLMDVQHYVDGEEWTWLQVGPYVISGKSRDVWAEAHCLISA